MRFAIHGSRNRVPPHKEVALFFSVYQFQRVLHSHAQARQQQFTAAEAEFLAQEIARLAHCYAHDPCRRTPWSVASCEQVGAIVLRVA